MGRARRSQLGNVHLGIRISPGSSAEHVASMVEIIAEHIRDEKTAHQIKAIPDMLEALETIMDIGDKACRDIARAAIKKARG